MYRILLLLLLVGCDTSGDSYEYPITGRWGTADAVFWTDVCCFVEIYVTEENGELSGSGTILQPTENKGEGLFQAINVAGSRSGNDVTFSFYLDSVTDSIGGAVTGTISGTTVRGELDWLDWQDNEIILTKR